MPGANFVRMKKLLLTLFIVCFTLAGLQGQTLSEKDLTADLKSLGVTATAMNAMLVDGNDVWMVPGSSWNNFRLLKTEGIVRWDGTNLSGYAKANGKLASDSVFRLVKWDTSVIALTASGPMRFDGSGFTAYTGFGALNTNNVYDAQQYGHLQVFGTDKGLVIKNKGVFTSYGSSSGLHPQGCTKVVTMGGKIYGVSGVSVFEMDTATRAITWPFQTAYVGSHTDIATVRGYLAITSMVYLDTNHFRIVFYKNKQHYQMTDVVEMCDIYGAELLRSRARLFGNGDRLLVNTFDILGKLVFIDDEGARGHEANYDVLKPPCYAFSNTETFMVAAENGKVLLRHADFKTFESSMSGIIMPVRQLAANNLGFAVGSANFNSLGGYDATRILSRECLSTIFTRSLWIGAKDTGGEIHSAATTYFQAGNNDFVPGPLGAMGKKSASWQEKYNRVWSVSAVDIEAHKAAFKKSGKVSNVAVSIKEWPVHEIDGTDTIWLAPFVDVNSNRIYDPENGDHPQIKGDEATFFVFNDSTEHSETDGLPFLVQVKGMAWAVHCPAWSGSDTFTMFDNTVFVEYELLNRSTLSYNNAFIGQWNDIDLGNYVDDYVGCLPNYNVAFGYNGDSMDEHKYLGFGSNPPVQNMLFLEGPRADGDGLDNDNDGVTDNSGEQCLMGSFMTYNNDGDTTRGNPHTTAGFYNLLQGKWLDGSAVKKDTNTVRFMFSHGEDPDNPALNWTMSNSSVMPADRRFVTAAGPFSWAPGQIVKQVVAYHYMEGTYQKDPASQVKRAANIIRSVYEREGWKDCQEAWLGTEEIPADKRSISVYPVPSGDAITLRIAGFHGTASVGIFDVQGRQQLHSADQHFASGESAVGIQSLSPGVYFVKVACEGQSYSLRILKQ
jgi:hypothetical protein